VAVSLFKSKFGKDPAEFCSLIEVNDFVESRVGHPLGVEQKHSDICSSRGSVFRKVEVSPDEIIEEALSE